MNVAIEQATVAHLDAWAGMRAALWPDDDIVRHREEAEGILRAGQAVVFVAIDEGGEAIGFAEASVRHDHVNGCDGSPVAFLEGLFVAPPCRRSGVAKALVMAVADWGAGRGCGELASDAPLANRDSHRFHAAIGFEEAKRVVFFRRTMRSAGSLAAPPGVP